MPNYYLHASNAKQALEALSKGLSCVRLSTDLNLSQQDFSLDDQGLKLDEVNQISVDELKFIAKKTQKIFLCHDGELDTLEERRSGYYKLVPTEGSPLLEISGVKMHISKGTDPLSAPPRWHSRRYARGTGCWIVAADWATRPSRLIVWAQGKCSASN